MASLGDSDKTIGVDGNKGVGFKSVFQVCDAPEVFSATDVDDPGFSGFVGAERLVELAVSRRKPTGQCQGAGSEAATTR